MFSIAYRMTGSVSDAEDIVQEAFLRAGKDGKDGGKDAEIESPKAYLATITTRLAIDHLRSARVRRESYVGTWLPEPLLAGSPVGPAAEPDPAELAETSDSLSMAFLVLLESLAPAERAVCLQTFARSRRRIDEGRPRFETSRAEGDELTALFLAAADGGDMTSLLERLAPDADGDLIAVIVFDVLGGQVLAIRTVANPEKLRHLGPISRTWHERWGQQEEGS